MWIARDRDGSLWLHTNKPNKNMTQWAEGDDYFEISSELFPEVKWEDEEPIELVLKQINEE